MPRHRFLPGRLVAGLSLTLAGVLYAGDAGGLWDTPWFMAIPVVAGGLCLAGAVGGLAGGLRKRRARGRPGADASRADLPG